MSTFSSLPQLQQLDWWSRRDLSLSFSSPHMSSGMGPKWIIYYFTIRLENPRERAHKYLLNATSTRSSFARSVEVWRMRAAAARTKDASLSRRERKMWAMAMVSSSPQPSKLYIFLRARQTTIVNCARRHTQLSTFSASIEASEIYVRWHLVQVQK